MADARFLKYIAESQNMQKRKSNKRRSRRFESSSVNEIDAAAREFEKNVDQVELVDPENLEVVEKPTNIDNNINPTTERRTSKKRTARMEDLDDELIMVIDPDADYDDISDAMNAREGAFVVDADSVVVTPEDEAAMDEYAGKLVYQGHLDGEFFFADRPLDEDSQDYPEGGAVLIGKIVPVDSEAIDPDDGSVVSASDDIDVTYVDEGDEEEYFEEAMMNRLFREFVKENYAKTIQSIRVKNVYKSPSGALRIECVLRSKSGKSTTVNFNASKLEKTGKRFSFSMMESKVLRATGRRPFIITGIVEGGRILPTAMKYSYKVESKTVHPKTKKRVVENFLVSGFHRI